MIFSPNRKAARGLPGRYANAGNYEPTVSLTFDAPTAARLQGGINSGGQPATLIVIYSYGDFRAATTVARSDDLAAKPIEISRDGCLPVNKVVAFFSNPSPTLMPRADGTDAK